MISPNACNPSAIGGVVKIDHWDSDEVFKHECYLAARPHWLACYLQVTLALWHRFCVKKTKLQVDDSILCCYATGVMGQ